MNNIIIDWIDYCIDCKVEPIKKYLLCGLCDDKLIIKIKKQIRDNWNWPFDRNENISSKKLETITKYTS